jgi:hypothetical protein
LSHLGLGFSSDLLPSDFSPKTLYANFLSPLPLPVQTLSIPFRNMLHVYVEQFLTSHQTPQLTCHPLSVFRDLLFIIFASTLHISGSAQSV